MQSNTYPLGLLIIIGVTPIYTSMKWYEELGLKKGEIENRTGVVLIKMN